jgi:hypothetical protein
VGISEGKKLLGRPRYRWEDQKRGLHSSVSAKGRVEGSCKHGNAPSVSKNRLTERLTRKRVLTEAVYSKVYRNSLRYFS